MAHFHNERCIRSLTRHLLATRQAAIAAAIGLGCLLPSVDALATPGNPTIYLRNDGYESVLSLSGSTIDENYLAAGLRSNYGSGTIAGASEGNPCGYVRSDGDNVVVFRGTNNHVWETYLNGTWIAQDLNLWGGANPAGDAFGYVRADGTNTVVYRDATGDIWELSLAWWGWAAADLTANYGGAKAAGDPRAFARSDGATSIVYRGTDNYIHEYRLSSAGWQTFRPSFTNDAAGNPTGYVRADGTNAVVYRNTSGDIIELSWSSGSWQRADLTANYNATKAIGDPSAYKRWDGYSSVVYRTNAGAIQELALSNQSGSNWLVGNIYAQGLTAGVTVATDPVGTVIQRGGYEKNAVVFRGSDGNVWEYYLSNDWNAPGWRAWNVSQNTGYGAPIAVNPGTPSGDPFVQNSIVNRAMAAHPEAPAVVGAVIVNDTVYYAWAGKRKSTDTTPTLQPTDKFQLGSVSKLYAGATLTRNVDAGRVAWTDTLGNVNYPWSNPQPQYLSATMAELSTHSSGMWYDSGEHMCGNCSATSSPSCSLCESYGVGPLPNTVAAGSFPSGDYGSVYYGPSARLLFTNDSMHDEPLFPGGTAQY
jgi:hypothetical protein